MAKFRIERNKDYTVMANYHFRDRTLSLRAKGLLSQMLSLPDNWDYTLVGLTKINPDKIDAVRSTIKELEDAGYVERTRDRDSSGKLQGSSYLIREKPISAKPTLAKPTLAETTQLNTNELSTNELSTNDEDDPPYPPLPTALRNPDYAEVSAEYQRQFALQPMGMTSEVLNQAIDSTCKEAVIYALQQTKANINKPNLRYIEKVIQSMESAGVTDAAGVQAYASPTPSPTKRPKAKSTDWAALTAQYKAEEDKNND